MSDNLAKEVEVEGNTYVVLPVSAQTQYKIFQKLSRYGIAPLFAGFAKAAADSDNKESIKMAFVQAIVGVITSMPEDEQDFCISEALSKTTLKGNEEPITISEFTGRIAEYILLGGRAIGVQLGDFSCFLGLIKESMAEAQEENASKTRP